MLLTNIDAWNVTALGTTELSLGRVTAVTGRAGTGKSTLLALVEQVRQAIAPLGNTRAELARFVAEGDVGAKVLLTFRFDEQEQGRFGLDERADVEVLIGKFGQATVDCTPELRTALRWFEATSEQGLFDAVPAQRTLDTVSGTFDLERYRAMASIGVEAKLAWVEGFCCDAALAAAMGDVGSGRDAINERLQALAPWLHLTGVERSDGGGPHQPVFLTRRGPQRGIRRLSAGERQLVLFAALDAALRPRRAILLVDQLERDLDPDSQRRLLSMLAAGGNQVVFTTASDALRRAPEVTTHIHLGPAFER